MLLRTWVPVEQRPLLETVSLSAAITPRQVRLPALGYVEAIRQYNAAIRVDLPEAQLLPGAAERRLSH